MNFLSKYDLIKYFGELGFTKGAEIGVAQGSFSESMFKAIPNLKLFCVDIWQPYRGNRWSGSRERNDNHYKATIKLLSRYNAVLIREMSMDAVQSFENNSLDFVFIDSNHSFDYVMQDLIEWSKKVSVGGIISGDDYCPIRNGGVIEAVNAYTKAHGIKFDLTDPYSKHIMDRGSPEQPVYYWRKE